MMKELDIKKVSMVNIPVESVPALLDEEKVAFQPVNTTNWAAYPYCPDAKFRMAYTSNAILVRYKVKENSMRAVADRDNGPVQEDLCVEFFSVPAEDGVYYNMECDCVGRSLVGAGIGRNGRRHAPQEVPDKMQCRFSLEREDFEERVEERSQEVVLVIPYSAFSMHDVTSLSGKTIHTNFYKYSDKLQTPHFLSQNPIDLERPSFYHSESFEELYFGQKGTTILQQPTGFIGDSCFRYHAVLK